MLPLLGNVELLSLWQQSPTEKISLSTGDLKELQGSSFMGFTIGNRVFALPGISLCLRDILDTCGAQVPRVLGEHFSIGSWLSPL